MFTEHAKELVDGLVRIARDYGTDACVPHLCYCLLRKDSVQRLLKSDFSVDILLNRSERLMLNSPQVARPSQKTALLLRTVSLAHKECNLRGRKGTEYSDLLYAVLKQNIEWVNNMFQEATVNKILGSYDIIKAIMKREGRLLNDVAIEEEGVIIVVESKEKKRCEYCSFELADSSKDFCSDICALKHDMRKRSRERPATWERWDDIDEPYYELRSGNW